MAITNAVPTTNSRITRGTVLVISTDQTIATTTINIITSSGAEVAWDGTSYQSGFSGTASETAGDGEFTFRRDAGWEDTSFTVNVVAGDGTSSVSYTISGEQEYPPLMEPFGDPAPGTNIEKLDDIGDVAAANPADLDVLGWDDGAGAWTPRAPSTPGAHNLNFHSDVNAPSPTDQQVLTWDNATSRWIAADSQGGGGTWGSITGTLSSQTDLQAALDAKVSESALNLDDVINSSSPDNDVNVSGSVILRDGGVAGIPLQLRATNTSSTPLNVSPAGSASPGILVNDGGASTSVYGRGIVTTASADHPLTPGGTYGQLWIRSADNRLIFTDNQGNDYAVSAATLDEVMQNGDNDVTLSNTVFWKDDGTPTVLFRVVGTASGSAGIIASLSSPSSIAFSANDGATAQTEILPGGVVINEQANHPLTLSNGSGRGQIWVRSSDSALVFTDEDNVDYNLTAAAAATPTLDDVINAGTPDNDVTVPGAVSLRDGGVALNVLQLFTNNASSTPLSIFAAGTTSQGILVNDGTASTSVYGRGLVVTASADHPLTPGGNYGQLWIRDSDNNLIFTDNSGVDVDLTTGAGGTPSLDSVVTAGGDNSMVVPLGDPIVFNDGAVAGTTPLSVTKTNSGAPALSISVNAETDVAISLSTVGTDMALTPAGIKFSDTASAPFTSGPGDGQLWVRSSDNALIYTDENSVDSNLLASVAPTLDDVLTGGTPDNNVVVPSTNPVVLQDSGSPADYEILKLTRNNNAATLAALKIDTNGDLDAIIVEDTVTGKSMEIGSTYVSPRGANNNAFFGGSDGGASPGATTFQGFLATAADIAGGNVFVSGGNATLGNANGGDLYLQGGNSSGTGTDGQVFIDGVAQNTVVGRISAGSGLSELLDAADLRTLLSISAFGAMLVDDADAAEGRTTLDVDQRGTDNSTDVTFTGTPDYVTINTGTQVVTVSKITLGTNHFNLATKANLNSIISDDVMLGANNVINSIETSAGDLQLVNDATTPGNDKLYGTNASGIRGWYDQPQVGQNLNGLSDVTLTAPTTDEILVKTATDWVNTTLGTNSITDNAVTLAKIATKADTNAGILGYNGNGDPVEIQHGTIGQVLVSVGSTAPAQFSEVNTAGVANNAITNAKLADMAAYSVKARAAGSTGDPIDVALGTNVVLGRKAGDIVAEQVENAQIANSTIVASTKLTATGTKDATTALRGSDVYALTPTVTSGAGAPSSTPAAVGDVYVDTTNDNSYIAADTTASGDWKQATGTAGSSLGGLSDVTLTSPATDAILIKTAGDWVDGTINTNSITDDAVSNAKLGNMAANTVKVNATAGSANPTDLAVGASQMIGRKATGNIVAMALPTLSRSITIEDPTTSEDITMFFTPVAITITKIVACTIGASSTINFDLYESALATRGTTTAINGSSITADNNGVTDTTFTNAGVAADSWVSIQTTTGGTGTPTELHVTVIYTEN